MKYGNCKRNSSYHNLILESDFVFLFTHALLFALITANYIKINFRKIKNGKYINTRYPSRDRITAHYPFPDRITTRYPSPDHITSYKVQTVIGFWPWQEYGAKIIRKILKDTNSQDVIANLLQRKFPKEILREKSHSVITSNKIHKHFYNFWRNLFLGYHTLTTEVTRIFLVMPDLARKWTADKS